MSLWRDCSTHTCSYSIQRNPLWKIIGITLIVIVVMSICIGITVHFTGGNNLTPLEKAEKLLTNILLFDAHNDFAFNMRGIVSNDLTRFNFSTNLTEIHEWAAPGYSHTDLVRLREGFIGAQFWVVKARCEAQFKDAVEITLEQIDAIKRLVANYSDDMAFATSAQEVKEAFDEGKIASLIGVHGGHSIHSSLAILRLYYDLGVRYLSLTQSNCPTPWADSASVDLPQMINVKPPNDGLSTTLGEEVIKEMNRIGMIIDLSHSSVATMKAVLIKSKVPVIFSNSNARELCGDLRNVPDEILNLVKYLNGLVMVNFDRTLLTCSNNASISDVVAHLDYLREKMSINNVGLGSGFDNIGKNSPEGLEDVSKYPNLFAALFESGTWTESDMQKLASGNLLRVMEEVEEYRDKLEEEEAPPAQMWVQKSDLKKLNFTSMCVTSKLYDPHPMMSPYGEFGRRH